MILRHAWPRLLGAGGFAGVELFFVLSGFLITSILVADEQSGVMSYGRFYVNRILRLYPALVAMLVGVSIVILVGDPLGDRGDLAQGVFTGLTYTSDLPHWPIHKPVEGNALWTLAIEEQFYLVWPVLLITFTRRGQVRRFCWAACAMAGAMTVVTVLYGEHTHVFEIYTWPFPWAVTLIVGAMFAVGAVKVRDARRMGWLGLIGLVAMCFVPDPKSHAYGYLVVLPLVAILGVMLVANAAGHEPLWFLLHPWVRYFGKISYAVYLWDWPFAQWISGPAAIPFSIAAASLSYYIIERPFLRLRRAPARPQSALPMKEALPREPAAGV